MAAGERCLWSLPSSSAWRCSCEHLFTCISVPRYRVPRYRVLLGVHLLHFLSRASHCSMEKPSPLSTIYLTVQLWYAFTAVLELWTHTYLQNNFTNYSVYCSIFESSRLHISEYSQVYIYIFFLTHFNEAVPYVSNIFRFCVFSLQIVLGSHTVLWSAIDVY